MSTPASTAVAIPALRPRTGGAFSSLQVLREIGREAFIGLARNRVRSGLSMLGISWGIVSVVMLLAYGEGFNQAILRGFNGAFGDGVSIIFAGQTSLQSGGERAGKRIRMRLVDGEAVGQLPLVKAWSPEFFNQATVAWRTKQASYLARAVAPAYGHMRSQVAAVGRFIDAEDVRLQRRSVFLGSEVALKLFGNSPPVGETVRINGMAFTVVGVMKEKIQLSNYNRPDKESVFIPYTTAGRMWNTEYLNTLVFEAMDPTLSSRATNQVKELLGKRLRFNPTDDAALRIFGRTSCRRSPPASCSAEAGADVHRRADARHRRRRRDEHHVRVGHRADARDRPAQSARRQAERHPHAVPARGLTTTFAGGALGVALSYVLVWLTSPRPFLSEILDDTTGTGDIHLILSFELVGICTAILVSSASSARSCRAAALAPRPIEALATNRIRARDELLWSRCPSVWCVGRGLGAGWRAR
jgi:putative ABC transport system permease protein